MSAYTREIRDLVAAVSSAVQRTGWSVDMIIDFGSHARCEARPDSDYDLKLYVHREEWRYLFEECARRVTDTNDEVHAWQQKLREHFRGYKELAGVLEHTARDVISRHAPASPVNIVNVFDTRHVLFDLSYETWALFNIVGGAALVGVDLHESLLAFLRSVRPFHCRTVEVHVTQCEMAKRRASEYASAAVGSGKDAPGARRMWLSSITTYLRNSLALLSLLTDGWFVTAKEEVLGFARQVKAGGHPLLKQLYRVKCEPHARADFLKSGQVAGEIGPLSVLEFHRRCMEFGAEIRLDVEKRAASRSEFRLAESQWLPDNLAKYESLPIYRQLVGRSQG